MYVTVLQLKQILAILINLIYSSIAQSVERMTVNHDVAGSSPAWGARNRKPVDDVFTGFFIVLVWAVCTRTARQILQFLRQIFVH